MSVTAVTSNKYKEALINKLIDLDNDSIKVLLMRDGFIFDKQDHHTFDNIRKSVVIDATGNTVTVTDATNKFARTSGSWITDGFVVGNSWTTTNFTNAANNDTFLISAVTALEITVTTLAGGDPALVDETNTTVVNLTFASDDELATGNGYTQDTKTTGATTVALDNVNNYANMTFPTVTWTASGGSIGPTPGAILYDDTTADDIIIGYIDFGGDQTTTDGNNFEIQNGEIREL